MTGPQSQVQVLLRDRSTFTVGANARMTVDRFVVSENGGSAVSVARGAFRFVSGRTARSSSREAISTPVGSIGVRGTILDILSQRGKTTVVLRDNSASRVCTLTFQCIELTKPGDTAVITFAGGKYTIQKSSTPPWTFACGAAAGLCSTTQYADATPTITPPVDDGSDPTGMLCGR